MRAILRVEENPVVKNIEITGNTSNWRSCFSTAQLAENLQAFLDTILKAKPSAAKGTYLRSATVSSTMGPGVRLDTSGYR